MKRQDLIRHVETNGCRLLCEGGKHCVYYNPANNQTSAIPRHREVNESSPARFAGIWGSQSLDCRTSASGFAGDSLVNGHMASLHFSAPTQDAKRQRGTECILPRYRIGLVEIFFASASG